MPNIILTIGGDEVMTQHNIEGMKELARQAEQLSCGELAVLRQMLIKIEVRKERELLELATRE